MGIVMITCPKTGRDISTGIEVDRDSFNATPVFYSRTFCRFCEVEHDWFAGDAWVCDEPQSLARAG